MADFEADQVLAQMVGAAKDAVANDWAEIENHAQARLKDLANRAAKIIVMVKAGQIDTDEAEAYLDGIRLNARNAFLTFAQTTKHLLIKAWNAAMSVLRTAVEEAAGIAIPL